MKDYIKAITLDFGCCPKLYAYKVQQQAVKWSSQASSPRFMGSSSGSKN